MVVLSKILEESLLYSSTYDQEYEVFLSFRGLDTRCSFTDHLHKALIVANIATFLDDKEIETGEDLKPELKRAIKASKASIIVLSKNYATSSWCLDELVLILEQRLISNHIVIPIFYHVAPTDVRKQQSSFGEAMREHKQRMEAETNTQKRSQLAQKIDRWIKALTNVADLKGMDVKGRRETEFIDEIVTNIHRMIGGHLKSPLPLLFGMEDSIEFITSWLKDGSSHRADILTILGMGGIGKTSLARYVYGLHSRLFDKSGFIEGIGQKCRAQVNGLLELQKQLCSDISGKSQIHVHDTLAYTSMIEKALTRKKVFIVLDDADTVEQLHALLGRQGFHPGSKIIITTKDASVTDKFAPNPIVQPKNTKHSLEGLHRNASLQLVSHHAFMCNSPTEGYEEVLKKLMAYCEGHPLALKVLGESLRNKTIDEWEDCIIGLKEEPDSSIKKALQLSFDSIPSNNDKELFKYIACFFVHKDRVFTEKILNSCGIRTLQGIRNLIDRCLLTIGPGNMLLMHQLLQEMGKDVVRQESLDKPEERSRIWCHEESFHVLEDNKGTGNIKGLVLDMKMLEIEKLCGSVELETDALSKMPNLLLLHLNFVQISGSYKNFPRKLRWLCMHYFCLESIPSDLRMENLVALDMSYSKIESFDMYTQRSGMRQEVTGSSSKDKRLLGSLKFLTLSFCEKLLSLGGFLEMPLLERLIARKCKVLSEICETIKQCLELSHIDLSYCTKLEKLPKTMGTLKKVKTLLVDGCELCELPIVRRDMDSQPSSGAIVKAIPNNFKFFSISLPSSLVRLSLAYNNLFNESFPMDFSCLSMLKDLCLDGNPIVFLPNCVKTLPRLETLGMNNCLKLKSVDHPPCTLKQLNIRHNSSKPDYKNFLKKILFNPGMASLKFIADRNILAPSSFEIEGMIKIQPMTGVEEKLLRSLGWRNIKLGKDWCTVTKDDYGSEECQIQMYYEFGIFSTIYGMGAPDPNWLIYEVGAPDPNWLIYEKSKAVTVPSSSRKLRGLNIYILGELFELPLIRVCNITKNYTWIYRHYIQSIRVDGEHYLEMLSHWMFGINEMEVGDEITITLEKYSSHRTNTVVRFVYEDGNIEDGEEDVLGYYKSWNHIISRDISAFQLTTGEYFLDSTEFLRSLFYDNAHYKERTIAFRAFSPSKSNILGRAPEGT